ncbi:PepSY-associated TM helix domain-containing protein [Ancylomarina sp. DW003]|nr:PepSY-associated TM helix domain-containing protein [Ancylomarina sp. DW003]MDE5420620.1 PepSY-associated TM helix domain-containing protein [Ancylomarina sp. DW003]
MNWNLKFRNWHRDFSYFYAALLIAFSISGIALNHRHSWDPRDYVYQTTDIKIDIPEDRETINDEFFENWLKENNIDLELRGTAWRRGGYNLYFGNAYAFINPFTGEGQIERFRVRPILGQMVDLHKSSSDVWIWYSDIFAICVLLICITGLIIAKGKHGFKKRGWKLAAIGILIPSIMWFFL